MDGLGQVGVVLAAAVLGALLTLILCARRQQARLAPLQRSQAEEAALAAERARTIGDLTQRNEQLAAALDAERQRAEALRADAAALRATLEQTRQTREDMTREFQALAGQVMAQHGEQFSRQNKEQIDLLLAPLQQKIVEFQQGLQTARIESEAGRARLGEQIRLLSEDSAKVRSEAHNLAEALRGKAQMRGAWGEMVLTTILEKSGLRQGEEYVVQQSHATADGGRVRSDAIVNLPGGQRLVIDSKVSLVAFESYVNAETEEARAECLARHAAAMRSQIASLSGKGYHAVAGGSLDYVVMFVPIEGALAAALQAAPDLTSVALAGNVCIATPTTLMIALRTAATVWQVERRNRNAEAIAERAGRLHDKLADFVKDMEGLGGRLSQARDSYDAAMKKLSTGNGNVLKQTQQLKDMGARANRALPPHLLGETEEAGVPERAAAPV